MKLLMTGGTGLIGGPLSRFLLDRGHQLVIVTRAVQGRVPQPNLRFVSWEGSDWQRAIAEAEGVISLAGASIAQRRWDAAQKQAIRESRVQTTRRLVSTIAVIEQKPAVLISASAVGYYGARGAEPLTEADAAGGGFLADTCQAWEAEAQRAQALGVRVVLLRLGLVLAPGGGALSKMVPPFRWFVGGPLGSGRQWVSWVHRDDVLGLVEWTLTHPEMSGAVNATAPDPVTMREFCRALGRALHRPSWAPVPSGILRLLLGEMAELLLSGQRVLPAAAQRAGYTFRYPDVHRALAACLQT